MIIMVRERKKYENNSAGSRPGWDEGVTWGLESQWGEKNPFSWAA